MTERKPFRERILTDRLSEWVDWIAEQVPHPIKAVLEKADDAHDVIGDAPEPYCNGACISAGELGLPYGGVAYAHPDCELHGGTE